MRNLHAIVIGATGATGKELVIRLLEDSDFSSVSIFVRKKPMISHKKLKTYEIDFSKIIDFRELIKGDVVKTIPQYIKKIESMKDIVIDMR